MTSSSPPPEVAKAIEAAKSAKRLQDTADALKAQAASVKDPAERERLWQAAYNKEVEARGQSKKAKLMASGWGQGVAGGIGASSALGMGLGNLVGVLVSGVVSIPGALVGAGVGAAHGPWYDVESGHAIHTKHEGGGEGGEESDSKEEEDDEEVHRAVVAAAREMEDEEEEEKKSQAG